MAERIVVDPMTRIEGHLRFETRVEDGVVVDARCSGDMYRGIENALIGYDARVAQQVTQRVCGVCPYAHAEAASLALESAMGLRPNENGQIVRNLVVGAYQLQDYLLHFYILCALDFVDVTAILDYRGRDAGMVALRDWVESELKSDKIFPASPFLPRYQGVYAADRELNLTAIRNYLDVLPVMADLHKMVAIFGGKAPHPVALEAGGATSVPTVENVGRYRTLLNRAAAFIRERYYHDVVGVAEAFPSYFDEGRGYGNLLSYPYFPEKDGSGFAFDGGATTGGKYGPLEIGRITEDHRYSYYSDEPSAGVRPLQSKGLTPISYAAYEAEHGKSDGKYSWTRAPRYGGEVMEVGPAARVVNTYLRGVNPELNRVVDRLNRQLGIGIGDYPSVMGRHLARYVCAEIIIQRLERQLDEVELGASAFIEREVPRNARGFGLTEATLGALGHWIETDDKGYIRNYEMIVPTTWNISPRDAEGRPGAVEKMLIGTPIRDPANPLELARVIRSTDPCMACSVH